MQATPHRVFAYGSNMHLPDLRRWPRPELHASARRAKPDENSSPQGQARRANSSVEIHGGWVSSQRDLLAIARPIAVGVGVRGIGPQCLLDVLIQSVLIHVGGGRATALAAVAGRVRCAGTATTGTTAYIPADQRPRRRRWPVLLAADPYRHSHAASAGRRKELRPHRYAPITRDLPPTGKRGRRAGARVTSCAPPCGMLAIRQASSTALCLCLGLTGPRPACSDPQAAGLSVAPDTQPCTRHQVMGA